MQILWRKLNNSSGIVFAEANNALLITYNVLFIFYVGLDQLNEQGISRSSKLMWCHQVHCPVKKQINTAQFFGGILEQKWK